MVVTGTASSRGTRKIDTSFSITTATEEQLKSASPSSTADVMKLVPGVYAESTGGQSGANIEVRGFPSGSDSPFVSVQMNGNPIYPVPVLSFFEGSSAFRLDDTIERVEVLRGGPSTIYSVGQPGATMNFILKKGDDTPEGTVRFTTGTGSLRRRRRLLQRQARRRLVRHASAASTAAPRACATRNSRPTTAAS